MEMTFNPSPFIWLLIIQSLALLGASQDPDFDFYYLLQQWPGSQHNVCYPTTGKPAQDFIIRGFWPSFNNGSIPTYCDPNSHFNETKMSDLLDIAQQDWPSLACPSSNGTQLWAQEWEKHGTCSQFVHDQYTYFLQALQIKENIVDILQMLQIYGIQADGQAYSLDKLKQSLYSSLGQVNVGIECNEDAYGRSQFYQVYICIHNSTTFVIDCPTLPESKCSDSVVFPSF